MSALTLKIIAVVTMLVDHMGAVIPEVFGFAPTGVNVFRVIGRVAFPLFVFLLAESFRHTQNRVKFLARLGVFAVISEAPFDLALRTDINFFAQTNIFYTLFLGGAAITAYELLREKSGAAAFLPLPAAMFLAHALSADYGAVGVAFIFCMYAAGSKVPRLAVMTFFCVFLHADTLLWILSAGFAAVPPLFIALIPATLAAVLPVAVYSGKRGASLKWFFYAFYPVHLAVLAMLATIS